MIGLLGLNRIYSKELKKNTFRIIPVIFDGKGFGADCWSVLGPVFPCKVCQTFFFT